MISLELAQVMVASVATVCMIGLGFLYGPSRASALWSLAFVVVMVCTSAAAVGTHAGLEALRVLAVGVMLSAPALIWSGLRALRGARPHEWLAALTAALAAIALPAAIGTDVYPWVFRIAFAVMAVFAALTVWELLRRPERASGTSMPLAVFSFVVVVVAAAALVGGLFTQGDGDSLGFLRSVNSLGMLAYIVCALVTLLFLVRRGVGVRTGSVFAEVATDRLSRAQAAGERSWALLYIRIDDAGDVRTVSGEGGFAALTDRLRADAAEIFPTEADIGRVEPAALAVLVAQPSTIIRERVRTLLLAIATPHDAVQAGTSASIGWAGVSEFGYDLDALMSAARGAADRAAAAGGDRWERAVN